MKMIAHWLPAAFCAALSVIALSAETGRDSGAWRPAFYCFLPMCFVFLALATSRMQREMDDLRRQVAELQQKKPS
ncbi:MAG: hypothetical protein N2689_07640 [Verrucomicrobiae bacterium]|nr:hypothetical protein [Verrucomicrobiae bacterium]